MTVRGAALLMLVCGTAQAWPVDNTVDVETGGEKFQKLAALDWFEVEDPSVASAEWLPSGDLFLSGRKPGRTLLLLGAQGRVATWRVRVAPKGERVKPVLTDDLLPEAGKACPGLQHNPTSDTEALVATIADERCRSALLAVFQTDAFRAKELDLTFTLPALQAQLMELQKGLPPGVDASYVGASLVLKGATHEAEHRRLLWEIFRRAVGHVALEDDVQVLHGPDAGSRRAADG